MPLIAFTPRYAPLVTAAGPHERPMLITRAPC